MGTTIIQGVTGSGKSAALLQQYHEWVHSGLRTDQILVLTAGAHQTAAWRRGMELMAHGPLEVHSFFSFLQRELTLFWALLQEGEPSLRPWLHPTFLDRAVAPYVMRGLLEPYELFFAEQLKAQPHRLATQLVNLATIGAAAGLSAQQIGSRLSKANRAAMAPVYHQVEALLAQYRQRCLEAGLVDYSLALHLFATHLLPNPRYQQRLGQRFRRLLVDDLDESVPVAQEFIASLLPQVEQAVLAINPNGGHSRFMGADPASALERFSHQANLITLPTTHTCSPAQVAFGEAVASRIQAEEIHLGPQDRHAGVIAERISADLWSDMLTQVVERVAALVEGGVPPGQIAIIAPLVDRTLEAALRQRLGVRPTQIPVQSLSPTRRLVDEEYGRALVTLAALSQPQWQIPLDPSHSGHALQLLLGLDPMRAARLGEQIAQAGGLLPEPDQLLPPHGMRPEQARAYGALRHWLDQARQQRWPVDSLAQLLLLEELAPCMGVETSTQLQRHQELLHLATRFQQALARLGEGAFGHAYVPLLAEATAITRSVEGATYHGDEAQSEAVRLATPYAYLRERLTSQYQVWFDLSSASWLPSDVQELLNPHLLSGHWVEGERWSERHALKIQRENGARIARALLHRCTGQLLLAESALNPWGQEQEGGLAEIFVEGGSR